MREKVRRLKQDAAFKEEVLRVASDGHAVSEVTLSLGIGKNTICRWKSRRKAKGNKRKEQVLPAPDYQALHRRIREWDILKMPCPFSVARPTSY